MYDFSTPPATVRFVGMGHRRSRRRCDYRGNNRVI
jgi:hypothetical protein